MVVGFSLVGATPEPGGRMHGFGGSFIGGRLRDWWETSVGAVVVPVEVFVGVENWRLSINRDRTYGNGTIDRTHGWAPWDSARVLRSLHWAALTRLTCLFAVSEFAGAAR